uniref:HDC14020 n=1 Tax=Drosophila melanogaster TaxID=7227 RepID=Q6IJX4_DROME|nr:TPA_inf: HDC14020 [Drosophila melanogaster]
MSRRRRSHFPGEWLPPGPQKICKIHNPFCLIISCRLLRKWNVGGYLRLCPVVEVAEGNGKGFYDYGTQRYLLGPESATL